MIRQLILAGMAVAFAQFACVPDLQARPLSSIRERGHLLVCANPNALPFAAKNGERRGVQLELAQALADQLGVALEVGWVVYSNQIFAVDCDIVLDSIVDAEAQGERNVKLSRPYQQSGVALAFRPGVEPVASYTDLKPGLRIGTMVSSVARVYLGKRDIATIPFTFEDEMMEALGKGEIDVAAVSPASIGFYNLTHKDAPMKATMGFASVPSSTGRSPSACARPMTPWSTPSMPPSKSCWPTVRCSASMRATGSSSMFRRRRRHSLASIMLRTIG